MKNKKVLLGLVALTSLVGLTGCGEIENEIDVEKANSVLKVNEALEALKGDVDVSISFLNQRKYDNPFYAGMYNISRGFTYEGKFRKANEGKSVSFDVSIGEDDDESTIKNQKGLYNATNGLKEENYLSYKNEEVVKYALNDGTSDRIDEKEEGGFNFLSLIDIKNVVFDEWLATSSFKNDAGVNSYAGKFFDFYSDESTITFKMEKGKFTSFTIEYAPFATRYTSSSDMSGVPFTAYLSATGTIKYNSEGNNEIKPVATNKIEKLDNILKKFDKNFTVQYLNSEMDVGKEALRIYYTEDRIVCDLMDIFSENADLGTLSWLDSIFEKNAETGKFEFHNLGMNEETGEFKWTTNKEVVESSKEYEVPDELYEFEKGAFDLDLKNIDTSLFTLAEKEKESDNDVYVLNEKQ